MVNDMPLEELAGKVVLDMNNCMDCWSILMVAFCTFNVA
jgi:hypothetical protein